MSLRLPHPRFYYGYIIVAAAFFIVLIGWGTFFTFGVFLKPVGESLPYGRAELSGAYSLATLIAGIGAIAMGKANDVFGPRLVISLCGLTAAMGYLFLSLTHQLWQFYLAFTIIGVGTAGFFVPPTSTVARWFTKNRTFMTGLVLIGGSIGTMVIPKVSSLLITNSGWRSSYAILGCLNLLGMLIFAQTLKPHPEERDASPEIVKGITFKAALFTSPFWLLSAIYFSFFFCINLVLAHLVAYATDFGIPLPTAASLMLVFGGSSIVGRIIMGTLGDRIGNTLTCLICFSLMFLSLLNLLLTQNLPSLSLSTASLGIAFAGLGALMSPLTADYFGLKEHGIILGFIYFADMVGGALGPVLAGTLYDLTQSYTQAFILAAIVSLMGALLILPLRTKSKADFTQ